MISDLGTDRTQISYGAQSRVSRSTTTRSGKSGSDADLCGHCPICREPCICKSPHGPSGLHHCEGAHRW